VKRIRRFFDRKTAADNQAPGKTERPAFDLKKAVEEWSRRLRSSEALEDGSIAELTAHVKDEIEELVGLGRSPEEAFHKVTGSVESAEAIGAEYYKTDAHGLLASLPQRPGRFSLALVLNSLKVSLRKMRRQKWYSLISITGLAVGMACSILILLWVRDELSYDRFHVNAKTIFRVVMEDHRADGVHVHPWLPFPLGPALQNEFPEISAVTRWRPDDMVVRYKDEAHTETGFLTVDPAFFEMFSFPFLRGHPAEALTDPKSIVIRDTMARKYFGGEDPLGKVLNLSGRADLVVSGVVHIPENSDFQFDFFFSFQSYPLFGVDPAPLESNWRAKNYHVYILIKEDSSPGLLEKKISGFLKPHNPDRNEVLRLQELGRIHLFNPDGSDGAMRYVRIFSLIAGFVLFIACVNFMNLSTARFEGRAKEVGLRKTLGGTRGQIIRSFFSESLLHSGLAMGAALLLVGLALPFFAQVTGRRLSLNLSHIDLALGLPAIALLAGFVSGLYPALFLSSFAPAQVVKTSPRPLGRGSRFRQALVVFQFTLSTVLIIGTLVVNSQVSFLMSRDLGLDKDNMVYLLMQKKTRDSVDAVRQELLKHPGIAGVSSTSQLPFNILSWAGYLDWDGRPADTQVYFAFSSVDFDFVRTCGLTLLQGRDFSRDHPSDHESFIINETARKQMGVEDPVGLMLNFWGHEGPIIGVVKDFTNQHMADATAPMVLTAGDWNASRNYLLLRLRPGNPAGALRYSREVWRKIHPGFPSEYRFADEAFNLMYTNELRLSGIISSFAVLAVLISCLGLIGLSSYLAEEKTKEVGIRKVLGASPRRIISLFTVKFMRLVLIANAVAWPLGYAFSHRWLQDYAFRTNIDIWTFLLAGSLGLATAFLSIAAQTLRAATANPVESLRYE
jgi:putative ABC transport system permease protein